MVRISAPMVTDMSISLLGNAAALQAGGAAARPPSSMKALRRVRSAPRVARSSASAQRCRTGRWRMPTFCSASSSAALRARALALYRIGWGGVTGG